MVEYHFADVELFKLTEERLENLGLKKEISVVQDDIFKDWVGKSVAKTEVDTADIDRTYESGLDKVNDVLNTVRLVAVWERLSRLDDVLLREQGCHIKVGVGSYTLVYIRRY